MTTAIDHATCSARLRDYVAGSLGDDDARAVEAHLQGCAECASELRAVVALAGSTASPSAAEPARPLSTPERARLRHAVASELGLSGELRPLRATSAGGWRGRLAPALAAAALIAVAAVAGGYLVNQTSGAGSSRAALERSAGGGSSAEAGKPEAAPAEPDASHDASFHRVGDLSPARLRNIGRESLATGPRLAGAAGTPGRAEQLAKELSVAAPPEVAGQVRECVAAVRAQTHGALPVYAARGRLAGRPVLVVSFVQGAPDRPSDARYRVYAWPAGSCSAPVTQTTGTTP
jgi:Putative zinc-finger